VILLGAWVDQGQIPLGRGQVRTVEVAGQHDEPVTPPRGGGFWQFHEPKVSHEAQPARAFLLGCALMRYS
jgi:hypothetical protein